ncbi:helix-turn-helix transcriptional regulator [Citrobacter sp. FP75]|uniref:helix-turn-helix transcriptional regulator n=1 Tax=Citrobacter sp. FP75 TaxID=1852949 RepID=UPI001BCA31A7|nr:helix-turn-helix transcriptional regulator [Citrobacter sp. FP75]
MDYSYFIALLNGVGDIKRNKMIVIMDSHFISFEQKKQISFFLNRFKQAEVAFLLLVNKKAPLQDDFFDISIFHFSKVFFRVCLYSELLPAQILSKIFEVKYRLLSGEMKKREGSPEKRMSEREEDILSRLMKGRSLHEIASELMLCYKTVTVYKYKIIKKFNCRTFRELYLLMN